MQQLSIHSNKIGRPHKEDAPHWYPPFWALAPGDDLLAALRDNQQSVTRLLDTIDPAQLDYRYAATKWTLKQVFIHLADEERYYAYKAFCCSRGVAALLEVPMSEAAYGDFNAAHRCLADIREELQAVRNATITLFQTMTPLMLDLRTEPQPDVYTARSLGWFASGHSNHHLKMIHEKYLNL